MEDGVLSLKIYCGKPYELDDEETILIRWNFLKKFVQEQQTKQQQFLKIPFNVNFKLFSSILQTANLPAKPQFAVVKA